MKLAGRNLVGTLAALAALALLAPLSWTSDVTGVASASGAAVCCVGIPADADADQCGTAGADLPAAGPCAAGCSGAFIVHPPSCVASLRYAIAQLGGDRLTGHDTLPDPFPPKTSAVA